MSSQGRTVQCKFCPKMLRLRDNKSGVCQECRAKRDDIRESESVTETIDGKREVTKVLSERVRTLEDLVRVCEIDLNEWEVERWACGKYETAMKLETREAVTPHRIIQSAPHVEQLFTVKATLRRRNVAVKTHEALNTALLEDIRTELTRSPLAKLGSARTETVDGPWLFEFAPFDLHMGKYAWAEETVTDYDAQKAEDLFNASLDFLLSRALKLTDGKLGRVLCVFGNDVAHVDQKRGQTTSGTPMDVDTRYIKIYRRICAIHRRAVDVLLQHAPVDIVIIPGNHDELTSFHLGEVLATRYENDPRVTVDNSAKLRKYYSYGVNLFGFAHGDAERVAELPLAMAREVPELWAKCSSREWHIGHKHITEKFEAGRVSQDYHSDKGVRIRRLTSLSGHDAWHTKHAYMDRRACEAFLFHQDAGFTSQLSFNVDHFTGKGMSK